MSNSETLRVGVLSLARPTFDVPFAEQVCTDAWNLLGKIQVNWIGSRELLFDAEGLNIVDAENDQESSAVAYSEIADEALICWDDYRTGSGYDLYCKYIYFSYI